MNLPIHAAALEKQPDDGLNRYEIMHLLNLIDPSSTATFVPFECEADEVESIAIGFIDRNTADMLDYKFDVIALALRPVMNDMTNESPTHLYQIKLSDDISINVWFGRNI